MNKIERHQLAEEIFEVLKRKGPQCQSQLSAELLVGAKEIEAALKELKESGAVETRPEHRAYLRDVEQPWGLRVSSLEPTL